MSRPMHSVPCRCGKTKKNFYNDIGEFYIETCCLIAGYDNLGNKEEEPEKEGPKRKYVPSGKYSNKKVE